MKLRSLAIASAILLAACGGGGGGGSGNAVINPPAANPPPVQEEAVEGLTIPQQISLITASSNGAQTASGKISFAAAGKAFDDPDTDYSTDSADVYVYDDSMQSLNLVNEIVCYMAQTRASDMVNEGPYIALVNEERCRQGENQSSAGESGQSSGGADTYAKWVIDSTRADNRSPQVVHLWVPEDEEEGGPRTILVEVTVTDGVSDRNPFGRFSMNFRGVINANGAEFMRGSMGTLDNDAGKPQFHLINIGGDALDSGIDFGFGYEEAVNVVLADAEGSAGSARTASAYTESHDSQDFSQAASWAIAYDASNFLSARDDDGDAQPDVYQCRARNEYFTRSWRYALYHAADGEFRGRAVEGGDRVELNSGFPFRFDADGDGVADSYGWAGYHGVWTEAGALPDGTLISQFDYDSDSVVERIVNVSPGKMIRRSASHAALLDLAGHEFQYWGWHPDLQMDGQWLVTVTESGAFVITAGFQWGDNGPEVFETVDHDGNPDTEEVPVAADLSFEAGEGLWLWSDALGGNVVYVHDPSVPVQDRSVTFFGEDFVEPDDALIADGPVTLYCYDNCLRGGLTAEDVTSAEGPDAFFHPFAEQPYTYTFMAEGAKVVLVDDANNGIVSTAGLDLSSFGNDWGINTGAMLTEPLGAGDDPWKAYDRAVSFRWETGPNDWNALVTVASLSGDVLQFDRPLQFHYVHSVENDANDDTGYDGARFLLDYNGPGDLHGFPWEHEEGSQRWYPGVTLADGTLLVDADNEFVVRALEQEQSMRGVDLAECDGLDVDAVLNDADLALPTAADIGQVTITLADRPEVDDAPAVIGGELQDRGQ